MVIGYEMKKGEYALVSWHTCPSCDKVYSCALLSGNYLKEMLMSDSYKCPNCGYSGCFHPYPSGFAEYRKDNKFPEPLWPIIKK